MIRDCLRRLLRDAGFASVIEPRIDGADSKLRGDIMFVTAEGSVVVDIALVCPYNKTYLQSFGGLLYKNPPDHEAYHAAVIARYEQTKRNKYASSFDDKSYRFIPFILTTDGVLGTEVKNFLIELANRAIPLSPLGARAQDPDVTLSPILPSVSLITSLIHATFNAVAAQVPHHKRVVSRD